MTIRQKTYAGGRKSGVWRVAFTDHRGVKRELSGYASESASMELDRLCGRLVEHYLGGLSLTVDEVRRVRDLDEKRRGKLTAWGLVDPALSVSAMALCDLIDTWEAAKLAEGVGDRWAEKASRVRRLLDGAGMRTWSDLCVADAPDRVRAWLGGNTASDQTRQHYLQAVKQFCRWVRVSRGPTASPVESMPGKAAVRQVRERGVLTRDEFGRLVVSAIERDWRIALVYGLAGTLGCDASTLRTLTRGNCERVDGVWCVTHRRAKTARTGYGFVTDPLIAGLLERRLAEVAPATPLLVFPATTARMIRSDLKAAGVAYKDDAGRRRDFHSLRAFAANEVCRVAQPKTARDMLAHASIETTMKYAKHAMTEDMLEAARKRPNIVDTRCVGGMIGLDR